MYVCGMCSKQRHGCIGNHYDHGSRTSNCEAMAAASEAEAIKEATSETVEEFVAIVAVAVAAVTAIEPAPAYNQYVVHICVCLV